MQLQYQILLNQYLLASNLKSCWSLKTALKYLVNKAAGFDELLPKLVKLSVEILRTVCCNKVLSAIIVINNSLKYGVFPDDAKMALVILLDKGKPNKNEVFNFRQVSIQDTF